MKHTKPFKEYTREEMLECLTECYVALVEIDRICKYGGPKDFLDIARAVKIPLDKMFERVAYDPPENSTK